ncbi:MAG: hypothetical protein E6G40_12245 [Actinobacteria bacterium]|nr:MAG: hypothetical protein E6G40_12245 [Actinomycetota bacterium]
MEMRISMRQERGGRWSAQSVDDPRIRASGASRERCLAGIRRAYERSRRSGEGAGPTTIVVEMIPMLAGVAEAAEVMGWDKRRVITYIDRGRFPEPLQSLASGRVWVRSEVEAFAREWRARRAARAKRS